jgi:hypothetical protein
MQCITRNYSIYMESILPEQDQGLKNIHAP